MAHSTVHICSAGRHQMITFKTDPGHILSISLVNSRLDDSIEFLLRCKCNHLTQSIECPINRCSVPPEFNVAFPSRVVSVKKKIKVRSFRYSDKDAKAVLQGPPWNSLSRLRPYCAMHIHDHIHPIHTTPEQRLLQVLQLRRCTILISVTISNKGLIASLVPHPISNWYSDCVQAVVCHSLEIIFDDPG